MTTVSIINLKGGTGKTVTACNMAAILAGEHKKSVLLIDADPQHNATDFFGVDAEACGGTTAGILDGFGDCWTDFVTETSWVGLDIVPSDISLINCDIAAVSAQLNGSGLLRGFLDAVKEDEAYDFCLIDCPPSFTAASVSAIVASDVVIIPVKVDAFALSGIAELAAQIAALRRVQPSVRIGGALVTMWHNAEVVCQGEELLRRSGIPVYRTTIRRTDKVDESTFARLPAHSYSKRCSAGQDYLRFVEEFLAMEEKDNG